MSAGDLGMPIGAERLQEQVVSARDVRAAERPTAEKTKVQAAEVSFYYGNTRALADINLNIQAHRVTALIGPSGCGKSTFLRCLNRMYEVLKKTKLVGEIRLDGEEIRKIDVTVLRQRVGMVFQKPTPFRKSIFDNVAFGPRSWGITRRSILKEKVEHSLKRAALWEEVKDRLDESAMRLSGGQQQRLCIARALASEPDVLLLDEPCSALDPIATAKVEDLLFDLSKICTVVIVTHNMEQAARVADFTGFFLMGQLVEFDRTEKIFTNPKDKRTEDYITGRFG